MEKYEEVEKSIQKKFRKTFLSAFGKALNEFDLIKPGDKIACCISGGKDSFLMAKLFQEIKRHNKYPFDVVYISMDPGYNEENRKKIEENAKLLNIPLEIFKTEIFDSVVNIEKSPCYICARMRRGYLYEKAREMGCNKIALGHHFDDVIETILMGMLYGGQVQTMMPKLKSTNHKGMELIRPMYYIKEDDIIHWQKYNELDFLSCACRFTEETSKADNEEKSKRKLVKKLIKELSEENPTVEKNIFGSVRGVNLDTIISYKKDGVIHDFLEEYEERE